MMKRVSALALATALLMPCLAKADDATPKAPECGLGSWEEWAPGNPEYRTPRTLKTINSASQGTLFDQDQSETIYNTFQSGDFLYTKQFVKGSSASTINYDLCRTYSPGTTSSTQDPPHAAQDDQEIEEEDPVIPSPKTPQALQLTKFDCKKSGWGEASRSPFDFPEGAVVLIRYGKTRVYEDDGVNHKSFDTLQFQGHTYTKDSRYKKDTGYSFDYGVCKSR